MNKACHTTKASANFKALDYRYIPFFALHIHYFCQWWTLPEPLLKRFNRFGFPLQQSLYPAIWKVSDPALDSQLLRLLLSRGTKPHPLNTTGDTTTNAGDH
jgi:hypothetical protein